MSQCKINHSDYINNGLITKIWGSPGWTFNHSVTFGYPIKPTDKQKEEYKNFFISLGNVLPCRFCRESYQKIITTGETALTNDVLNDRETLTKWFYRVHKAVNKKLEIDYGMTYDEVVDKYESFRAKCGKPSQTSKGCVAPLDYKAFSFKKLYYVETPIVPLGIVTNFVDLAKKRILDDRYFIFLDLAYCLKGDINKLKKQPCWMDRNKLCYKQIKKMRINGIMSIEESGEWKNTPTIDELKLLMFLSSNLNLTELHNAQKSIE